jgi:hypothetical protein
MKVGLNNVAATVKEIKIMKDLNCPYALKYYGCYRKDEFIWVCCSHALILWTAVLTRVTLDYYGVRRCRFGARYFGRA